MCSSSQVVEEFVPRMRAPYETSSSVLRSSSLANVSSLTLMCNFAEITEDTEGNQEDFTNAKEEAIDEEKAGQESEAGLDQWHDRTTSPPCYAIRISDCCGD